MSGQDTYSSKSIKWDDIPEKDHFQSDYDVINTRNEKLGLDNNYGIKKENITIKDNWEGQKVQYKNRLIDNPIYMGGGPGGGAPQGDTGVYGSPGCFTGKSMTEKHQMCGVHPIGNFHSGADTRAAGLLTTVTFQVKSGKSTFEFNKYAAADLQAICSEICSQVPWYNLNIGNTFRPSNSVPSGTSRHCLGLALDINPGSAGNPWFSGIGRSGGRMPSTEPAQGSSPQWGCKKCPYNGTYDRSKCIWSYDHPVVKIFYAHGWGWGGDYGDVMHFSIDGH